MSAIVFYDALHFRSVIIEIDLLTESWRDVVGDGLERPFLFFFVLLGAVFARAKICIRDPAAEGAPKPAVADQAAGILPAKIGFVGLIMYLRLFALQPIRIAFG